MANFTTPPDSDLVHDAISGNMDAFASIYDRYADRLNTYCFAMLRDRDDAADAVQDTFLKAATRLDQLRDTSKLRPWLFSIARNEAHARGRQRARSAPVEDLSETLIDEPDMTEGLRQAELKEMVWAAADGLSERDRELMTLHLVEGLEGVDLATALGVSTPHVHVLVSRMKDRVEKSIGALLIARLGNDDCDRLADLLAKWDGNFSLDVRSRVTRHVESCDTCSTRRAALLAPANVLPSVMLVPAPADLRRTVLRDVEKVLGTGSKVGGWKVAAVIAGGAALFAATAWFGVSAFDQSNGSSPLPVTPAISPTTTTVPSTVTPASPTTTSESPTTTTTPPTTTTTLTPPSPPIVQNDPLPAALAVSTDRVDFGDRGVTETIELRNDGDESTEWLMIGDLAAVSVAPNGGNLGGGESVVITVTLDRTLLAEGVTNGEIVAMSPTSNASVAVSASYQEIPRVQTPAMSPLEVFVAGGACNPMLTTVAVVVTDESAIASVVIRWNPTGTLPIETQMSALSSNVYSAMVGPFNIPGSSPLDVIATDIHGNTGSASSSIFVLSC